MTNETSPMFTVITGNERFKITDLVTGGESFAEEKFDAYKTAAYVRNVLMHAVKIEDRRDNWSSINYYVVMNEVRP